MSELTRANLESVFDDEWGAKAAEEFLPDNIFIESAQAFAALAYNKHLSKAGKVIFIDKTPRYYHILRFIDQLFPKAKKVWLQRNPLDVALSYKKTWNITAEIITGQHLTTASYDFAVGLFNLADYFKTPAPDKCEIQYETLVQSPVETLTKLCHFINVPFEEQMLAYAHNDSVVSLHKSSSVGDKKALSTPSLHSQSLGNWAKELSKAEIQQLVALLGFDVFRQMGYHGTIDTLKELGIPFCSETEAAASRYRICSANINKMMEIKEQLQYKEHLIESKEKQVQYLTAENQRLSLLVNTVLNSKSWRLTAPLRNVAAVIKGLKRT
jgi:hypothetical protein